MQFFFCEVNIQIVYSSQRFFDMFVLFSCAQVMTVKYFMVIHKIVLVILVCQIDTRIMDVLHVYEKG